MLDPPSQEDRSRDCGWQGAEGVFYNLPFSPTTGIKVFAERCPQGILVPQFRFLDARCELLLLHSNEMYLGFAIATETEESSGQHNSLASLTIPNLACSPTPFLLSPIIHPVPCTQSQSFPEFVRRAVSP